MGFCRTDVSLNNRCHDLLQLLDGVKHEGRETSAGEGRETCADEGWETCVDATGEGRREVMRVLAPLLMLSFFSHLPSRDNNSRIKQGLKVLLEKINLKSLLVETHLFILETITSIFGGRGYQGE